ncbi:MAG: TonB C-terminal domain-containing protein [Limisphaerales bacterium]
MSQRRKSNSSKVNLTISLIFHTLLVLAVFFLAAREGMLGKKLKELTVTAVKEKKPEPPKEKAPEPKVETAKQAEAPKTVAVAQALRMENTPAPPPSGAPSLAAPPPADVPSMEFTDGAKAVFTESDPKVLYKGLVESALRAHWNRREDIADDSYVAEIELAIDPRGNVTGSTWLKGSGDARWDTSVKAAVAATKVISRPPPKGFPGKVVARFDVELMQTEEVFKVSSR